MPRPRRRLTRYRSYTWYGRNRRPGSAIRRLLGYALVLTLLVAPAILFSRPEERPQAPADRVVESAPVPDPVPSTAPPAPESGGPGASVAVPEAAAEPAASEPALAPNAPAPAPAATIQAAPERPAPRAETRTRRKPRADEPVAETPAPRQRPPVRLRGPM